MVRRRGRLRPRAKALGRPPCFPAAMYFRRMPRIATCRPADAVRLLADGFGRGRLKRASLEARKRCRAWPAQIPEAALFRSPYRAARFPPGNCQAARGGGSCRRTFVRRAWCRQSAALYSRPMDGSKWGGGGVAPAEWRVQRTPNGVLSLPGLVAGPVSAWQLPGGALSGGVPPDIMRGGAYCPAAIAAGRSWGFGLGPGRRTEADGVATGPRACNRRHGYGPVGAGMGSEWRKVEEGTGACGRTRAYAWGRGRRGHRQDRETA